VLANVRWSVVDQSNEFVFGSKDAENQLGIGDVIAVNGSLLRVRVVSADGVLALVLNEVL
jgi:hypothetical protein